MCVARVMGPIAAGTFFSWNAAPVAGLSGTHSYYLSNVILMPHYYIIDMHIDVSNQWRVYGMMAVGAVVTFLLSLGLPRDLNHARTSQLRNSGNTLNDDDHDTSLSISSASHHASISHAGNGSGYGYGSTYNSNTPVGRRSTNDMAALSLSTASHHRTLSIAASRDRSMSSSSLAASLPLSSSNVHTTKYSYASRRLRHPSFTDQQLRRPKTIVMGGRTSYN